MTGTSARGLRPSTSSAQPVFTLLKKLRSSVRTGRKLHLDREEIAILLRPEIYDAISRLEAEEMRRVCALDADNDNSLGIIGSGSDLAPKRGQSAGLKTDLEALSRGARARALSEVKLTTRRRKQ